MKLVWSRRSLGQLESIRRHHRDLPPVVINGVLDRLEQNLKRACEFPQSAPAGREPGTRELVVSGTNYVVVYSVKQNTIVVLAVLHSSQDWPEH